MKKRISALFLTLAMLLCCSVAVMPSFAEQEPTIVLSNEYLVLGWGDGIVKTTVAVYIENNPGIWGLDLKISYNRDVMTLTNVKNGYFFSDSEWTPGNLNAETYTLSYEANGLENVTKDSGTLALLEFDVREDAPNGTYEISASYNVGDIINVSFEELPFVVENGSIQVPERDPYWFQLTPQYAVCYLGDNPIKLEAYTANKLELTWSSEDESIVELKEGTSTDRYACVYAIPHKAGTVGIKVTSVDGGRVHWCALTVMNRPNEACNGDEACPGIRFSDMPKIGNWAHAGIDYAVSNGLFAGMDDTTFAPNTVMTRAMLVRVLWKLAGSPAHNGENPFSDVKSGAWFYDGVVWAACNNIVAGMGDGTFAPNEPVTREQIASILHRYTEWIGGDLRYTADLSAFPDATEISTWAEEALAWAYANLIISGDLSDGVAYLRPKNDATRAQVAAMLMRFCRLHEIRN